MVADGAKPVLLFGYDVASKKWMPMPRMAVNAEGYPNVTIVDNLGNQVGATEHTTGNYHLDVNVIQGITLSPTNSSTANLNAGATFTGTLVSTLGVGAIQVSLKTDQNCTVYVDQSPDGTNWDISDSFDYWNVINNFSQTVQAVNSYVRVRVKNIGTSATTYFRLQTVLAPIIEALPRSLSPDGHLRTHLFGNTDHYGFEAEYSPMGEQRMSSTYRLVGSIFTGTTVDPNFWTPTLGTGGTVAQANSQVTISTGTTANNTTILQSVRTARYVGGQAILFRSIVQFPDTGTANNTRRWGPHSATDGAFFELSGTTLSVVTRKTSSDTKVSNGSFNGERGPNYTLDTNAHVYEVYWTNKFVYFVIDEFIVHTVDAAAATWSDTKNFPIRFYNANSGGSTTNVSFSVRVATISRIGTASTQPTSSFINATTAGTVLKYGAGNLHCLVIGNITNTSAITIYDNTAASGTILWASGAMNGNVNPFTIDFQNMPFYTGLTIVVATQASNITIVYE